MIKYNNINVLNHFYDVKKIFSKTLIVFEIMCDPG